MKILIVSTNDNRGGGAKVAYSLAEELRKNGHKVLMYVSKKTLNKNWIVQSSVSSIKKKLNHFLDSLPGVILSKDKHIPFGLGHFGESLETIINDFKPDIVNVHWVGKGFVSFKEIVGISKNTPIVWTLHDMGAVSGGNYFEHKHFDNKKSFLNRLMKWNERRKERLISNSQIQFVTPSEFMRNLVKKSRVGRKLPVTVINNGINRENFKVNNKVEVRRKLNLNKDRKYILFGATDIRNDRAKGFDLLIKALLSKKNFLEKSNIGLISFGQVNPFNEEGLKELNVEKQFLGYISSEKKLSQIYSSADLLLFTSISENYPLTLLECISSDTPVIAFNVGGISEIIQTKDMGTLISPFKTKNMGDAMEKLLKRKSNIEIKTNDYSVKKMTREYEKLFRNLTAKSRV